MVDDDKQAFKFLLNPQNWEEYGDCLARAAYKLESERDWPITNYVYFMLIGFALENYYKGAIILLRNNKHLKSIEKGELPKDLKNHNLLKLAKNAKLPIANKSYINQLSECVRWRGRYPTPLVAEEIYGKIRHFPPKNRGASLTTSITTELSTTIATDAVHDLISQAKNNLIMLKQTIEISK